MQTTIDTQAPLLRTLVLLPIVLLVASGCGQRVGREDDGGTGGTTGAGSSSEGADETGGSDESGIVLELPSEDVQALSLHMTREEVAELFGDDASGILLLELEPTELLTGALESIRSACGDDWNALDCSQTPLGQTFMGPDGTWQTSREYALVRLLTMTPDNVDVSGTSSEGLAQLADWLASIGIIEDYGGILAEALEIAATDPILDTAPLVESFRERFVATHPVVGPEGRLHITLDDALSDLETLTERYGPTDDGHPGVIDPSVPVHGEVFGPEFLMTVVAHSNVRSVSGIDGTQHGTVSKVIDQTGPAYDDPLDFDFGDPERFYLEGLVEDLAVDLRVPLVEDPEWVYPCIDPGCEQNLPDASFGEGHVWAREQWTFEYLVAYGAYLSYQTLESCVPKVGLPVVEVGGGCSSMDDPPGWLHYGALVPAAPPDQYVWETILDVAQQRLHHDGFADFLEGVEMGFTLEDVPCGLTGAAAAEAVRPGLQDQASEIADIILPEVPQYNDPVDFYYMRAADGEPYLFFATAEDRADGMDPGYANPGFFTDLGLTDKASSTLVIGVSDSSHEKLALPPGESTYYFQDDNGTIHRARFEVGADESAITVWVSEVS